MTSEDVSAGVRHSARPRACLSPPATARSLLLGSDFDFEPFERVHPLLKVLRTVCVDSAHTPLGHDLERGHILPGDRYDLDARDALVFKVPARLVVVPLARVVDEHRGQELEVAPLPGRHFLSQLGQVAGTDDLLTLLLLFLWLSGGWRGRCEETLDKRASPLPLPLRWDGNRRHLQQRQKALALAVVVAQRPRHDRLFGIDAARL